MPVNQDIECDTCGRLFAQGFATLNHARLCTGPRDDERDRSDDDAGFHDEGGFADVAEGSEDEAAASSITVSAHLNKLEAAGTLDCTHLLQYLGWGKVTLTPEDLEVCRFLRSVEQGGGASSSSMRASLDYARSLGGRGDVLPRTIRSCWSRMEKVINPHYHCTCSLPTIVANVHCPLSLQMFIAHYRYACSLSTVVAHVHCPLSLGMFIAQYRCTCSFPTIVPPNHYTREGPQDAQWTHDHSQM